MARISCGFCTSWLNRSCGQIAADGGGIGEAGAASGVAAELDRLALRFAVKRAVDLQRQMAVAHQEQQFDRLAELLGQRLALRLDPPGEGVHHGSEHVVAERRHRIIRPVQRQRGAVRGVSRRGAAHPVIDHRRGRGFEPQALGTGFVELAQVDAVDAEQGGRVLVRDLVVADVEDGFGADVERAEHRLEQPFRLGQAEGG
jgi:hypothetical protein